ncbi:MAG: phosphatidylglycerophosphatase A [Candidatus Dadabacteria bacterium]|nr:MAG: phosphatidylglycerophosphatase A [Candidatus Dadabacteria bacterium]
MSAKTKPVFISSRIIATGFFSGYAPYLSGTAGSLVLLLLWVLLKSAGVITSHFEQLLFILLITVAGTLATGVYLKVLIKENPAGKINDPKEVVIDEWAGMAISLFSALYYGPVAAIIAFVIFRLLDIWKPGPIGIVEKLPAEWGIMADDILAGIVTAALVSLLWPKVCGMY